ncbi:hypothetical protein [Leptospira andrefontaineae]|uniref:Uncharacterized protein n=1 Tax=Leptospira andrefontaineae TaxID=2484976 RepID=A0A4R9GX27_9LEPT|nr:hypothetical protein [Leptospira andrefontaineae]TGK36247.1 hypothetical protein EHO65_18260 [Leptospira andrefontaineae]
MAKKEKPLNLYHIVYEEDGVRKTAHVAGIDVSDARNKLEIRLGKTKLSDKLRYINNRRHDGLYIP